MSRGILIVLLALSPSLVSCQFLGKKTGPLEISEETRSRYRVELDRAWTAYAEGDFQTSLAWFRNFQKDHPQTIFDAEARLGEARSLEGLGEWTLAHGIYGELIRGRLATQPEIASLAMFLQAGTSEALGNESGMMASLRDAAHNAAHLPSEVRMAALPARKAVALFKLGRTDEAKKALREADQGLNVLKAQGLPPAKWAELYLQMGTMATNQIAAENFQAHLDGFSAVQLFLLKSVEAGASPWSDRALEEIKARYQDLRSAALQPPVSSALDKGARERLRAELQRRWLAEISRLAVLLRQHQRPSDLTPSPQEARLNAFLDGLEREIEIALTEKGTSLPLTPEARMRQKLRVDGKVRSEPHFPAEKQGKGLSGEPGAAEPSSDPNL